MVAPRQPYICFFRWPDGLTAVIASGKNMPPAWKGRWHSFYLNRGAKESKCEPAGIPTENGKGHPRSGDDERTVPVVWSGCERSLEHDRRLKSY
jgi:hypothetical protein